MSQIKNIGDLAEVLGLNRECVKQFNGESTIAKALFKGTTCGILFDYTSKGILLAGYCEGSDLECEAYFLAYPFTEEEFWATVTQADEDGLDVWDATHGCEKCWPNGCMDEWDNLFEAGEPGGPVDPDCTYCRGEGVSI